MVILGLGDGQDAGAALVVDDRVVAVARQERADGVPRSRGLPLQAAAGVLAQAGVEPAEVDLVALAGRFTPPLALRRHPEWRSVARDPFSPVLRAGALWQEVVRGTGLGALHAEQTAEWLDGRLREHGYRPRRVLVLDLHKCLAAAAYRSQPDDGAMVVTLHPRGDGVLASVHVGRAGQLDKVWEQPGATSLHAHLDRCVAAMGLDPEVDSDRLGAIGANAAPDPELGDLLDGHLRLDGGKLRGRGRGRRADQTFQRLGDLPLPVAARTVSEHLAKVLLPFVRELAERHDARTIALGGAWLEDPWTVARLAEGLGGRRIRSGPLGGSSALALGAAQSLAGTSPGYLRPPGLGPSPDPRACRDAAAGQEAVDAGPGALAAALADGRVVGRFAGPEGFSRCGGGGRSVLVRADDASALDRARLALGLDGGARPTILTLPEVERGAVLAGPLLYGAAAVPQPEPVARALGGDGRAPAREVHEADEPDLAVALTSLRERIGCDAVAAFGLSLGQDPVVTRPEDAVRVFRDAGLDALQLGPVWLERR